MMSQYFIAIFIYSSSLQRGGEFQKALISRDGHRRGRRGKEARWGGGGLGERRGQGGALFKRRRGQCVSGVDVNGGGELGASWRLKMWSKTARRAEVFHAVATRRPSGGGRTLIRARRILARHGGDSDLPRRTLRSHRRQAHACATPRGAQGGVRTQ